MEEKYSMQAKVCTWLARAAPHIDAFWRDGGKVTWGTGGFFANADYIYAHVLLGKASELSEDAARRFAEAVGDAPLAGRAGCKDPLLPHLSAYVLGALNLLALEGHDYRALALGPINLDVASLIAGDTRLPRWPRIWSHHVWRVGHWIGGIPAILLSFARHDPKQTISEGLVVSVLEACDRHILVNGTGLMQPYRNHILQSLFRTAYRFRHDPLLADIGGLVHLHWINYATGRPYKAVSALIERCMADLQRRPFLEVMPYCLDFDYIQLLRTSLEQTPEHGTDAVVARAAEYAGDLVRFLSAIPASGYSLHQIPGALAALHEAALIAGTKSVPGIGCPPVDVIKKAYWL